MGEEAISKIIRRLMFRDLFYVISGFLELLHE